MNDNRRSPPARSASKGVHDSPLLALRAGLAFDSAPDQSYILAPTQCRIGRPCPFLQSQETQQMSMWSAQLLAFLRNEDGPTSVEYAVMLAVIVVFCIASINVLGNDAKSTFTTVANKIGPTGS
jgi:pilus assembly protein Flp/PilA